MAEVLSNACMSIGASSNVTETSDEKKVTLSGRVQTYSSESLEETQAMEEHEPVSPTSSVHPRRDPSMCSCGSRQPFGGKAPRPSQSSFSCLSEEVLYICTPFWLQKLAPRKSVQKQFEEQVKVGNSHSKGDRANPSNS